MNNILTTKLNPPVSLKPQIERTLIFNHLDQ